MPIPLKSLSEITSILTKAITSTGYNLAKAEALALKEVPQAQHLLVERGLPKLFQSQLEAQGMSKGAAQVLNVSKYLLDSGGVVLPKEGKWSAYNTPIMEAVHTPVDKVRTGKWWLFQTKNNRTPWSHSNVNEYFFGTSGNLSYDWAGAKLAENTGKAQHHTEWSRIFGGIKPVWGTKAFKEDLKSTVGAALESGSVENYFKLEAQASKLRDIMRTTKKEAVTKKAGLALQKLQPKVNEAFQKVEAYRVPFLYRWAQKPEGASIRMGLALESKAHPWADKLLSEPERKIVARAREYLNGVKSEADQLKIPMIGDEYAPHPWAAVVGALGGKHKVLAEQLYATRVPSKMKWMQRSPGSLNWLPDADLMMRMAINQSNSKFANTRFLNKWHGYLEGAKNTPWSGKGLKQIRPEAYNYSSRWIKDYFEHEKEPGKLNRALDWIVWGEYLSKIGGTISVPVKHAFKQLFLLSHSPQQALKATPMTLGSVGRLAMQNRGFTPELKDRVMSQLLSAKYIYRAMSGLEDVTGRNAFMRAVEKASAGMVSSVEYFERGASIYAAMMKGLDRGLSYHETMRGVYQIMTDINFLGIVDRPSWLDSPIKRLSLLFFFTPFKIAERTFVKWPIGSAAHLNELYRNRGQVIQAFGKSLQAGDYQKFKEGLIQATLKAPKDAFGTSYTQNMVRAFMAIGAAEAIGQYGFDTSVLSHIVHIPGIRHGMQGMEITPPPYVQVYNNWREMGGDALAIRQVLFDHFWPTMATKAYRISKGDMPEMYNRSAGRYLTAFPHEPTKKRLEAEARDRAEKPTARRKERFQTYRERNIPPWARGE